jgi:hypothetical protein
MSRTKPTLRTIKLLCLIERNANGLRVQDMAEQKAYGFNVQGSRCPLNFERSS